MEATSDTPSAPTDPATIMRTRFRHTQVDSPGLTLRWPRRTTVAPRPEPKQQVKAQSSPSSAGAAPLRKHAFVHLDGQRLAVGLGDADCEFHLPQVHDASVAKIVQPAWRRDQAVGTLLETRCQHIHGDDDCHPLGRRGEREPNSWRLTSKGPPRTDAQRVHAGHELRSTAGTS